MGSVLQAMGMRETDGRLGRWGGGGKNRSPVSLKFAPQATMATNRWICMSKTRPLLTGVLGLGG